jgi:hypothetical protein
MSAEAWVVECAACKCKITCVAIDPQGEHGNGKSLIAPMSSAVLQCPCCDSAYRYTGADMTRGIPRRNPACEKRRLQQQPAVGKLDGAVLIAATMVAAMRLRGEDVKPSPKVMATVSDSIALAKMVLARMERVN